MVGPVAPYIFPSPVCNWAPSLAPVLPLGRAPPASRIHLIRVSSEPPKAFFFLKNSCRGPFNSRHGSRPL